MTTQQLEEAECEITRVLEEKRLGKAAEFIFIIRAFFRARKCTADYIRAVIAGGVSILCSCGYHPSRRKIRTFLKETVKDDLESVSGAFYTFGADTEVGRAAKLFLQAFDVLRKVLDRPDVLKISYINSEVAHEMLPESMRDVVRRLCAGEINAEQADNELIELKGHYEALIGEMGIKPAESSVLFER